nr:basic proline-rich protein-like [Oryctolagus cuniculus]
MSGRSGQEAAPATVRPGDQSPRGRARPPGAFIFQLPVPRRSRTHSPPPPSARVTSQDQIRGEASRAGRSASTCAAPGSSREAGRVRGGPEGASAPPARPPARFLRRREPPGPAAAAARPRWGAPLTEAARWAPGRSPPRARRSAPPAAASSPSSRRALEGSAAAAATPAAEASPPGAHSRPHLPPPHGRRGSSRPALPAPARGGSGGGAGGCGGGGGAGRPAATRRARARGVPRRRPACQSRRGRRHSQTPWQRRGPSQMPSPPPPRVTSGGVEGGAATPRGAARPGRPHARVRGRGVRAWAPRGRPLEFPTSRSPPPSAVSYLPESPGPKLPPASGPPTPPPGVVGPLRGLGGRRGRSRSPPPRLQLLRPQSPRGPPCPLCRPPCFSLAAWTPKLGPPPPRSRRAGSRGAL